MTAEAFTELSARSKALLAKQEQLLQPIRERRTRFLSVLTNVRLIIDNRKEHASGSIPDSRLRPATKAGEVPSST